MTDAVVYAIGGMVALLLLWRFVDTRRKEQSQRHLTVAEFWVFLPVAEMPEQDQVMDAVLHHPGPRRTLAEPAGPPEGLVMSDIRLHIALVSRAKNPHGFRPDLYADLWDLTPEQLEGLHESAAFVKIRFVSEQPVGNRHYLRLTTLLADAYARLGNATVIYDVIAERMWTPSEFRGEMERTPIAHAADFHVRVTWKADRQCAETRGLLKIGHPELRSAEASADHETLLRGLFAQAIPLVWEGRNDDDTIDVQLFDDTYRLEIIETRNHFASVRVLRRQAS